MENATLNPTTAQYNVYPARRAASFCIELGKWGVSTATSSFSDKSSEELASKLSGVIAWATKSGNKWGKKQITIQNNLSRVIKKETRTLKEKYQDIRKGVIILSINSI